MSVKMQPTSVIKVNLGIDPNGRVQRFFATTCAVPFAAVSVMSDAVLPL